MAQRYLIGISFFALLTLVDAGWVKANPIVDKIQTAINNCAQNDSAPVKKEQSTFCRALTSLFLQKVSLTPKEFNKPSDTRLLGIGIYLKADEPFSSENVFAGRQLGVLYIPKNSQTIFVAGVKPEGSDEQQMADGVIKQITSMITSLPKKPAQEMMIPQKILNDLAKLKPSLTHPFSAYPSLVDTLQFNKSPIFGTIQRIKLNNGLFCLVVYQSEKNNTFKFLGVHAWIFVELPLKSNK